MTGLQRAILGAERTLTSIIESDDDLNLGPLIRWLNEVRPVNRFTRASVGRIVQALRNAGYVVRQSGGRYYVYR